MHKLERALQIAAIVDGHKKGYTLPQIADFVGVSVSTVQRRLTLLSLKAAGVCGKRRV